MPTSELEICNLALAHLGEAPIASLAGTDAVSLACAAQYVATRDAALREHRWNFALQRIVLAPDGTPPAFGWSRRFALPADCLRVLEVNDSEIGDWVDSPYAVEGRFILSEDAELRVIYVKQVTNVAHFDALFAEALPLKLAARLSEVIRGTTQKTEELLNAYTRLVAPVARRVDANEGRRRKGLIAQNSLALKARQTGDWSYRRNLN